MIWLHSLLSHIVTGEFLWHRFVKEMDAMLRESWMSIPLKELKPSHLAEYRDRRLQTIKPASFNRQFCIIVHACRIAKDEYGLAFCESAEQVSQKPCKLAKITFKLTDGRI